MSDIMSVSNEREVLKKNMKEVKEKKWKYLRLTWIETLWSVYILN
jgi:hypothetical protein